MNYLKEQWKENKLYCLLVISWLLTVASSFFGSYLLPVELPRVGTWYAFRTLLPITALLYLVYAIKTKKFFWRDSVKLEKWCYVFIVCMVLYGAASLLRALDFVWTFRRLVNLCFDLCFFFLMLRLCRKKEIRRLTLLLCFAFWIAMMILGIYEVFCGGIMISRYDVIKRFFLFDGCFQCPVVFFANTNDYAAMLVFFYAVFALIPMKEKMLPSRVIVILSPVVYFLLLASDARLCELAFFLVVAVQLISWILKTKRAAARSVIALCLCFGCVWLAHQWQFTVEPFVTYCKAYQEYLTEGKEKPDFSAVFKKNESLHNQFFITDEETGETTLREDNSAGIRANLLIHSWNCFKESYGLGIGLGNTETLAPVRGVIPAWANNPQNSIHCFLARIVADCGIFALIPLCAIAILMLKNILTLLVDAIRKKNRPTVAYALLLLAALLAYPILSTAPSDAQDILSMWMYLAFMVLFCVQASISDHTNIPRNEQLEDA